MATENTGYQGSKILQQKYADTGELTGLIMPNIQQVSPQSIVDGGVNSITYNYPTDATPTGGINGDIWYNPGEDELFKKIAGTWTILLDRVTNDAYVAPVYNITSCPLP